MKKQRVSARVAAILAVQQRVELARAQLEQVHHLDPRWPDVVNEFSDAQEARRQLEQSGEQS